MSTENISTEILAWARNFEVLPKLFWEKTSSEHPRIIEDDRVWAWDGYRYWPIAWTWRAGFGFAGLNHKTKEVA